MTSVLIEAGTNPDSRSLDDGATPLLTWMGTEPGKSAVPLDLPAENRHYLEVVRELVGAADWDRRMWRCERGCRGSPSGCDEPKSGYVSWPR